MEVVESPKALRSEIKITYATTFPLAKETSLSLSGTIFQEDASP